MIELIFTAFFFSPAFCIFLQLMPVCIFSNPPIFLQLFPILHSSERVLYSAHTYALSGCTNVLSNRPIPAHLPSPHPASPDPTLPFPAAPAHHSISTRAHPSLRPPPPLKSLAAAGRACSSVALGRREGSECCVQLSHCSYVRAARLRCCCSVEAL